MTPSKQWTTALTPEEAVERLAQACAALDKIANYTCRDEVYYGSLGDFARYALDKVMEPSAALPNAAGSSAPACLPQSWDVVVLEVGHTELLPDQTKAELADTLNFYLPRPGAEIHIKAHGANAHA